jgi:hypothetical protein
MNMIELTEEQRRAVQARSGRPLPMVDPETQQAFVLVRAEDFEKMLDYDDSPWTDEEMDQLAAEAGEMLDSFGKQP